MGSISGVTPGPDGHTPAERGTRGAVADNRAGTFAGLSTMDSFAGPTATDREDEGPIDLLTVGEVAELLRVSDSWIYLAIQDERIPSLRIGGPDGPIRFLRSELVAYVHACRVGPHPPRRSDPGCPDTPAPASTRPTRTRGDQREGGRR